jgi:malate dehydrogenase (oxaloacetate-decarboxylating)
VSRVPLEQVRDLRTVYTPGVARVVRAIEREPTLAWELTSVGNSVGIYTNGSRVLGLGNVGVLASMPVMEGKAVIYDRMAGISATPILIDTLDPDELIETIVRTSRTFAGIHLEDIRSPDCFRIEAELIRRLDRPVMHDDQHGTATVTLAAVINVCRLVGKDLRTACVGQIGLGAAGSAIARLVHAYGVGEVIVHDPSETAVARVGLHAVDLPTLMAKADIVIAATGRPGLVQPAMIRRGQVILSLSNPEPEIDPSAALEAGAAFASDGRTVNNCLAFPGLFRGAFDARCAKITVEMLVAAANAIADRAEAGEIVPPPLDRDVHRAVAHAVAAKAEELKLSRAQP